MVFEPNQGDIKFTQDIPKPYWAGEICDYAELSCPHCHQAQLHLVEVKVIHAGTEGNVVTVTSDGVALDPRKGSPAKERGVVVEITYSCEFCPDVITIHSFQFRKGTTLWDIRKSRLTPGVIWRD